MNPQDVTLDLALKILALPRTLGNHPQTGQPILAFDGKFGPYIRCGDEQSKETRSLPAGRFAAGRDARSRRWSFLPSPRPRAAAAARVKREPLKVFAASPVTNNPVQLLSGRYGPYVTDGATNASLPRGTAPEELTFEYALNLLKVRAEQGPSERQLKRAAAKKPATEKKTKKTTKKSGKKPDKEA